MFPEFVLMYCIIICCIAASGIAAGIGPGLGRSGVAEGIVDIVELKQNDKNLIQDSKDPNFWYQKKWE